MSFGKSTRFRGPGSYLPSHVLESDAENKPGQLNMNTSGTPKKTSALKNVMKKEALGTFSPRRETPDGLPSFMQQTSATIARQNSKKEASKDRLQFQMGEGGNTYAPVPEFGKDAKGSTHMKKGKHGRFSILDSYFVQAKGSGADAVGLGHEDDKVIKKKIAAAVPIEPKTVRFGKGSYLEAAFNDSPKLGFLRAHQEFLPIEEDTSGTSSFKSKTKIDRSEWTKASTYLQDKELAECEGPQRLVEARSLDFDVDNFLDPQPSSAFKDTTKRFQEIKLEPGSCNLGPPLDSQAIPEPRFGVVYKKDTKHGRFSEFGSMFWQPKQEKEEKQS